MFQNYPRFLEFWRLTSPAAVIAFQSMKVVSPPPITLSRNPSMALPTPQQAPFNGEDPLSQSMTESFMSSSTSSQPGHPNPIFGLPSLLSSLPTATEAPRDYPFRMEDLMDWAPISGNP